MNAEPLRNNPPPVEVEVTEEDWSSWKEHPTTKTFRRYLGKQLGETYDAWVAGAFTGKQSSETLQMNSSAIGKGQLLKDLLELTAEDINVGLSNE